MIVRRIRDFSLLGAANLVAKAGWFAFTVVYCAHVLSPYNYGVFLTALSLSLLVASTFEGGFYPYVMRTLGVPDGLGETSRMITLRLLVGLTSVLVTIALASRSHFAVDLAALAFGGIYVTGLGVRSILRAIMESRGALPTEGGFLLVERLGGIAWASLLLAVWEASPRALLLGLALGQTQVCVAQAWWIHRRALPLRLVRISGEWIQRTGRVLLPLALMGCMGTLYYRSDQVIVERVMGAEAAGQYGLMFQALLGLNLLPSLVSESLLFPRFARWWRADHKPRMHRWVGTACGALLALGIFVASGVTVGASWTLETFGLDAYREGLPILKILVWTFPISGVHAVLNVALLAASQDRTLVAILATGAVLSISGVLVAARNFDLVGVAWMTVLAEVVVTLGCAGAYIRLSRFTQ